MSGVKRDAANKNHKTSRQEKQTMLTKMKKRLVSALLGTAMAVAPMSLGTCEMMYTPPVEGSGVTIPVENPSTEGAGTGSTEGGAIGGDPSGSGSGSYGYGPWAYAGAWTGSGQNGSFAFAGSGRP